MSLGTKKPETSRLEELGVREALRPLSGDVVVRQRPRG
jgi:hypothetical protein